MEDLLARCDFGRAPWRVDVTVTTTDGDEAEHVRTLHLSYRPKAGGGLLEDPLYRNLHPMLAKRLDLWRLANFRLERLASAEDVYLFRGVAHDNPKDARLFALAEIRDLTPVVDAAGASVATPGSGGWECSAWPRCGRPWRRSPRATRPTSNRIVLYVRPLWDVPRDSWPDLAPHASRRWPWASACRRCCCGCGSPSRTGR